MTGAPDVPQECLDAILAVLVLYRRNVGETESYRTLGRSLAACGGTLDLLVWDNSPAPGAPPAAGASWRVRSYHDPGNSGVSRAFNAAASLATELGKIWLLLLDQDTLFPEEAVAAYCQALREHPEYPLFAPRLLADGRLCSPCGLRAGIGYRLARASTGAFRLAGRGVLNSGMLVRLDAFRACGGFDERVRLDFADFVFMDRLRRSHDRGWLLGLDCRHGFSGSEATSLEAALERFAVFCRDGRAAATTPLYRCTHRFLMARRCLRLMCLYRSARFAGVLLGRRPEQRGDRT